MFINCAASNKMCGSGDILTRASEETVNKSFSEREHQSSLLIVIFFKKVRTAAMLVFGDKLIHEDGNFIVLNINMATMHTFCSVFPRKMSDVDDIYMITVAR